MVESFAIALRRIALWAQASEARKGRGLVLLALTVYLPAFSGGFVWDDWILVTEPLIRRVDGIVSIWFAPWEISHEDHYWPLVYTSFWIEHKLWGLHPAGYHAVNIVLHALNSVLVWRLLFRLSVPGAWLVGAVFAAHPVHVESVAWIIERKDLLSAAFYLAAVHVWLGFTKTPGSARYLLSLSLFLGALLSKSIAVTLPAALLLLDWWRDGRVTWSHVVRLAPFFTLALGITLADLVFYHGRVGHAFDYSLDYSLVERVLIAARALWIYVYQLGWPAHLPVFYSRWEVHSGDILGWFALAALVTLGVALWFARSRIGRGPFVGALFFALTLSPVLGFVNFGFMRIAFVADRFQYLASIGPVAVVVAIAVHRLSRFRPRFRAGAIVVAAATLAVLGTLTWRQSEIYRDDVTFARHAVALNPRQPYGQVLLSEVLNIAGHYEDALVAAERAIDLTDRDGGIDSAAAYAAKGSVLLSLDYPVRAETVIRRSLALWPRGRESGRRLDLARSLARQARYKEGLEIYRRLLVDERVHDVAHLQMGRTFLESGRYEAAIESFRRALAVVRHPDNEIGMYALLGEALHKLGRLDDAAARLDQGLAQRPGHVRLLLARADVEFARQRATGLSTGSRHVTDPAARHETVPADTDTWLAEAREQCDTLIEHEPEHPLARVLLGAVLLRLEQYDAAEAALDHAFSLAPSRPIAREAHRVMGRIREKQGRSEDAARHYQNALEIHALDAEALERLAALQLAAGRYEDALPLYRRLVKATPFVAQAHLQLGATLHRLGRFAEALPVVERAFELDPGLEDAHNVRAGIREALGGPHGNSGPRIKSGVTE